MMRENSQRAGAQVDNFQFTPRLFSGMWGREAVALEKQFTKKRKNKQTNKHDLDGSLRREGAGHLSQVII
jgi:hypothetical protein